jgi:recombination associated protein RdgC
MIMWFKNLQVYRIGQIINLDGLNAFPFTPCSANEMKSIGWSHPREHGNFYHVVNGQTLLCFTSEKRSLPASAVKETVKVRAAEIEEQQGFKPGRKMLKEIKEQVIDELMPRALPIRKNTFVWLDINKGWLVIDTGSNSVADDVLKLLLLSLPELQIEILRLNLSPITGMTDWLAGDEAPAGFTIDQDCELQSKGESRAKVKYTRHSLNPVEIANHITAGKVCISLAMTWKDKISFVLKDSLAIKRVAPLDVLTENSAGVDQDERLDGDFVLMAGELNLMLNDLVLALGGMVQS